MDVYKLTFLGIASTMIIVVLYILNVM